MRPDNPWDLKGCWQKQGESLLEYTRLFSQKCHELPMICNVEINLAFYSGINCQTRVHELGRDQPKTTKELLDIATRHASGEEAVGAVFVQSTGKVAPGGGRRH
jgi:hypothetical protein